ncbi:uncharacterized protein [Amphiura filiformis]|uniref:uncharacterized protein n=1 Tax=Amphiura filiformis TaxID=82378 RepID=UPI003B20F579
MEFRATLMLITSALVLCRVLHNISSHFDSVQAEHYFNHTGCGHKSPSNITICHGMTSTLENQNYLAAVLSNCKTASSNGNKLINHMLSNHGTSQNEVLLRFLCTNLLLLAGDLESNPGPYKSKYPCTVCNLAYFDSDSEILWAQLQLQGAKAWFIGCFYRPPSDGEYSLSEFEKSLDSLAEKSNTKNMLIGGDFNLGDIDWDSHSVPKYANHSNLCHKLLAISNDHNLSQMVTEPTHRTDDTENILDLILTSNPTVVDNLYHMPGLGVCKHDVIMTHVNISPQRARTPPRRVSMYKHLDSEAFTNDAEKLKDSYFQSDPEGKSVQDNWTFFRNVLQHLTEKHIPTKLVRPSRDLPWMTRDLKRQIRRKQRWFKRAKHSKGRHVWETYKNIQKATKQSFRKAYWDYINNTLSPRMEENPKIFWRFVKALKRDNTSISALRDNGQLISEPKGKAEVLNKYFKSVFTREDMTNIPEPTTPEFPRMQNFTITEEGALQTLGKLRSG